MFVGNDAVAMPKSVSVLIIESGGTASRFGRSEDFLADYRPDDRHCLLVNAYLPGMNGVGLLRKLRDAGDLISTVMITGNSDVAMAVQAMRAGASDSLEKPVKADDILASINQALKRSHDGGEVLA